MPCDLLSAVDAAVQQALPDGWPRVRSDRLPACGSQRARHAFKLQDHTGPAAYLVIAVAPPFLSRCAPSVRGDLEALIDRVLARGASLLLLYDADDDPDSWLRNGLSCPHPRFLCLACTPGLGGACTTEPTHAGREPLADTIRDLWSGELYYRGPTDGPQTVGVEVLLDTCWRCDSTIETVTGIVFPDRKVEDWTAPEWTYFRQLLELAALPDVLIPPLAAAIETWRAQAEIAAGAIRTGDATGNPEPQEPPETSTETSEGSETSETPATPESLLNTETATPARPGGAAGPRAAGDVLAVGPPLPNAVGLTPAAAASRLRSAGASSSAARPLDAPAPPAAASALNGCDAFAALDALEAHHALDALEATDALESIDTLDATDALESIDTLDAVDALDALDAIDAIDAIDTIYSIDAIDASDEIRRGGTDKAFGSCDLAPEVWGVPGHDGSWKAADEGASADDRHRLGAVPAYSALTLTPIRWRYSRTAAHAYWAAECPVCTAFRGAFHVMERRLPLLHDLRARHSGELRYIPLDLDIPRDALRALMWGCETSAHARPLGWYRADIHDPETLPRQRDAMLTPPRPLVPARGYPQPPRNRFNPHLPPGTPYLPPALHQASHSAPPPAASPGTVPPQVVPPDFAPSSAEPQKAGAPSAAGLCAGQEADSLPPAHRGAPTSMPAVARVLCHADPQGNLHPLAVRSSRREAARGTGEVSKLDVDAAPQASRLRRLGTALFGGRMPWARR